MGSACVSHLDREQEDFISHFVSIANEVSVNEEKTIGSFSQRRRRGSPDRLGQKLAFSLYN